MKIPKRVLNTFVGVSWNPEGPDFEHTIGSELKSFKEEVECGYYKFFPNMDKLETFQAYTKTYVLVLMQGLMGDKYLLGLHRNPPKEYKRKKK